MDAEKTGCFVDVVDHLNRQNLKLMVMRDAMAGQEDNEGWYFIINDMMEESEAIREKVSMLHLRTPGGRKGGS